jgi:pimeloyl-ACP methyl ester carboxylesterase
MLKEKTFKGDVDVNYAEGPENGLPLLLIHGTMNRWQAFLRHIPSLLPRWHVYAKDFRGHGRSGRGEHYGYDFFYRDTERFIEQNIKKPTVVFGHSLGGRVALKLAAERPELVKAIILGDSSMNEPEPSPD